MNSPRSAVPVLLFLQRIASLTLIECEGGITREVVLTRTERPLSGIAVVGDLRLAHVDLGELGGYTVASGPVDPDRLHAAVQVARRANLISDDWDYWDDAVVSIAVPSDFEVTGRIYTFLPMGDKAPSPFAGHLNGPFFTKLDRTNLDPAHPLNNLLLDVAAEVALRAAATLCTTPAPAARDWVSDLVCWDGPHRHRLVAAAERSLAAPLIEQRLVPVEAMTGREDGWASLTEAYCWPMGTFNVLSAARAAETGSCLLDSTLSAGRTAAWERMGDWLDCPLTPEPEALAEMVETILRQSHRPATYDDADRTLGSRRAKASRAKKPAKTTQSSPPAEALRASEWAGVYADLAVLFGVDERKALRGRLILVDDGGDLRPTNTPGPPASGRRGARRVSAFLPPTRDEKPVSIPASLRRHLFISTQPSLSSSRLRLAPSSSRQLLSTPTTFAAFSSTSTACSPARTANGRIGRRCASSSRSTTTARFPRAPVSPRWASESRPTAEKCCRHAAPPSDPAGPTAVVSISDWSSRSQAARHRDLAA